jgi:NhaP-type Na+/H+ or K+/H+ antiporter
LLVWFLFGASMLIPGVTDLGWRDLVFAVLALTVVRMIPTAISLIGSGLDRATVAFIGWFGPRGLASIVFCLIAIDELPAGTGKVVLGAGVATVGLSVLVHGVTARPFAGWYGRHASSLGTARPEHVGTPHLTTRSLTSQLRRPWTK